MTNNDYILHAVKGEPNSLTSIAFNTGVIAERARIIKLLTTKKQSMVEQGLNAREIWGIGMAIALILIKGENK